MVEPLKMNAVYVMVMVLLMVPVTALAMNWMNAVTVVVMELL